jgi:hypothetical protein
LLNLTCLRTTIAINPISIITLKLSKILTITTDFHTFLVFLYVNVTIIATLFGFLDADGTGVLWFDVIVRVTDTSKETVGLGEWDAVLV